MERLRDRLAGDGKCGNCRTPRKPKQRCAVCRILRGRVLEGDVNNVVNTPGDQWRRDGDGWARFRGKGKRGAPPAAQNDEADLTEALKSLEKGRHALAYAHSAEVKELGPIQRKAARAAAASILAHAARFIDDVVDRHLGGVDRRIGT